MAVHIGKSESLAIVDESKLPAAKRFWKPQPPLALKTELKAALKAGEISEADGVRLESKEFLVWR